ncbi:unnamed protein product [Scytosiphon promiscuus]
MNTALQDDDLWRRAFSANAGLFFDNHVSEFGPLLSGDGTLMSSPADQVAMPPTSPAATTQNASISAAIAPTPAMDFASAVPAARQQQQQQQQQQQHQPHLRVKIASRPTLVTPPAAAAAAAAASAAVSEDFPFLQARAMFSAQQQQQQRILGPSPVLAREVNAQAPSNTPIAEGGAPAHEAAAAAEDDPLQQGGAAPSTQRGGESFARKRDRAKLLRQQMNDGLDSLHEALVEISASGANPSAAAATSLIPTRGPRRAAVVACSAGLVRDLIASCVALRAENASISQQLSAALATAAAAQQQQQQQQREQQAAIPATVPEAGGDSAEEGSADGQLERRKRHDDGATHGGGEVGAKVFGQLLSLSVFGFLGPQSLEESRKVSREWRDKCTWDCSWSNLCVSRWRLGPEQRHAEVWRVPDRRSNGGGVMMGAEAGEGSARAVVSPPPLPPSWRSIYGRLHRELRGPTGAFSPSHMVLGKSVHEGVAIWIALNRRSNGMTGRSVMGHDSAGFRTTEVIELRAVVQRVDEGPAIRVHPCAFAVRQVSGMRAYLRNGGGGGGTSGGPMITTTGIFPPVSQGEDRFAPRFTVNTGGPDSTSTSAAGTGPPWREPVTLPAGDAGTPPLALFEYATVDFFIEAAGCPTEADFLRLEACVDVAVSQAATPGAAAAAPAVGGARSETPPRLHALSVGLTEANPPPSLPRSSAYGLHAMGVEMGRPIKRRF